jgi:hypothetical protein
MTLDHAALLQVLEAMKVDQALFAVIMKAYLHGGVDLHGRRCGQSVGHRLRGIQVGSAECQWKYLLFPHD